MLPNPAQTTVRERASTTKATFKLTFKLTCPLHFERIISAERIINKNVFELILDIFDLLRASPYSHFGKLLSRPISLIEQGRRS